MVEFFIGVIIGFIALMLSVWLFTQLKHEWIGWTIGWTIIVIMSISMGQHIIGSGIFFGGLFAAVTLLAVIPVKNTGAKQ